MAHSTLAATIERVAPHDHLCLIYESQAEQFAAVAPYLKGALARNERFLYAIDENTAAEVMDGMRAADIDVDAAVADGALILATKRETYLRGGAFDPDAMIRFMADAAREAVEVGFRGVSITGEMTWALAGEPGADRLVEYEAKLNRFFPHADASAICQYNASRFSPETLEQILETHPQVIYGGVVAKNAYYVPPSEYLQPAQTEARVRRLLRNIVEREQTEAEVRRLNETLERRVLERTRDLAAANGDLERFASMVSHDLRAPLRGITFYVEALRHDFEGRLPDASQEYIAGIERETARSLRLVHDILRLSHSDQAAVARERIDLSKAAHEILAQSQREHPLRRVAVDVQPDGIAWGDAGLLRTVIQNLLDNAWKYTLREPDGRIRVSWEDTPEGRVFRVEDNGVGFPAHLAPQLFQPFHRLHGAEFSGSGVGLATVKRIVDRHGGRVWAESGGHGARFSILLPTGADAPA